MKVIPGSSATGGAAVFAYSFASFVSPSFTKKQIRFACTDRENGKKK